MNTGERIRHYRKVRDLTQKELAGKIGVSETSIRLYELGKRKPGEKQLEAIASVLKISPLALGSYEIRSAREAMEFLFRLEDAIGLEPISETTLGFDKKHERAPKASMAIKIWKDMRDKLKNGEITEEDYDLWRAGLSN